MNLRHQFDENSGKWLFSVVDAIGIFAQTSDPRNYWKVLKNRLKRTHLELVTKCNQLKMLSKDGKYYLTDVADAETILRIAELVPGSNIKEIEGYLCFFEDGKSEPEFKSRLLLDASETNTEILIKIFVAGISSSELFIFVFPNEIVIKGERNIDE